MGLKSVGGWLVRHREAIAKAVKVFLELRKAK